MMSFNTVRLFRVPQLIVCRRYSSFNYKSLAASTLMHDNKHIIDSAAAKATELKTSTIETGIQQAVQTLNIATTEIQKQGVRSTATVTLNLGVLQLSLSQKIDVPDEN